MGAAAVAAVAVISTAVAAVAVASLSVAAVAVAAMASTAARAAAVASVEVAIVTGCSCHSCAMKVRNSLDSPSQPCDVATNLYY